MKRKDAIETIMRTIGSRDLVVSTTGLISREIFEKFHSERNLYIPGSMGLVSSIGLGLAIACPTMKVAIIDGDASLLMNLGSIVTIGNIKPNNLLHLIIDNEAYGSCNEEKSMSDSAHLNILAKSVGYQYVRKVDTRYKLRHAILSFTKGPGFILTKVELGGRRDFLRPLKLIDVKIKFMRFVEQQKQRKKYDIPRKTHI